MGITTRSIHGFENPGKRGIGGVKLEALRLGGRSIHAPTEAL